MQSLSYSRQLKYRTFCKFCLFFYHQKCPNASPSRYLKQLMEEHFPRVALLFKECSKFWEEAAILNGKGASMEFGSLFYSMAINLDLGERVESWPHRDLMNLAVGLCVIYVFGAYRTFCRTFKS